MQMGAARRFSATLAGGTSGTCSRARVASQPPQLTPSARGGAARQAKLPSRANPHEWCIEGDGDSFQRNANRQTDCFAGFPTPTNARHCVNGICLKYKPAE
jgi:hypothetical protein